MQKQREYVDSEDEILEAFRYNVLASVVLCCTCNLYRFVVNFLYFNTRVFDVDGTGRVSAAELREVLTSLGEKLTVDEVEELFSEGEVDEDGMIDYHTICQAVLQ